MVGQVVRYFSCKAHHNPVNYYLYGEVARFSVEADYLPEGSPISDSGNGILATGAAAKTSGFSHGGGNELIFRAQFQLAL